jgi:4-amino-4-deoxy-L-arabinose transferase-like glycosyltransferase
MASTGTSWHHISRQLDEPASWAHRAALMAMILLGLLLRWYLLHAGHAFNVDTIRDEINSVKYALALLAGEPNAWYLAQPALHQGHIPGPLWTLLVAAFYTLGGNSAEGALFWMMLLNSVVIYPFYLFASRLLPARAALFTTVFFAAAPWPIYYAAGLYNPLALPLLSVFMFWALWQTINVEQSRAIFGVLLLTAMVLQLHMVAIFYVPAILILLWLAPTRLNLRWLGAGLLAGVVIYLPYLIGEITHHWANTKAVLSGGEKFNWGVLKFLTTLPEMLSNHPGGWPGDTTAELKAFGDRYFGSYVLLLAINLISFGLALVFVYGFIRRFYNVLRNARFNFKTALREQRLTVFLGVLLVLPLLLYFLLGKDYASRYSIIIFPLLFVLPALSLPRLKSARTRRYVLLSLTVMIVCNLYVVWAFALDQQRKLTREPQYMPAFYKLENLYRTLRADAGPDRTIALDMTHYPTAGNHYSEVASEAIPNYIATYEAHLPPRTNPRLVKQYMLTDAPAQVPADARIVFQDNGLVIYAR